MMRLMADGYDVGAGFPVLQWPEQFTDTSPKRSVIYALESTSSGSQVLTSLRHCNLEKLVVLIGTRCRPSKMQISLFMRLDGKYILCYAGSKYILWSCTFFLLNDIFKKRIHLSSQRGPCACRHQWRIQSPLELLSTATVWAVKVFRSLSMVGMTIMIFLFWNGTNNLLTLHPNELP